LTVDKLKISSPMNHLSTLDELGWADDEQVSAVNDQVRSLVQDLRGARKYAVCTWHICVLPRPPPRAVRSCASLSLLTTASASLIYRWLAWRSQTRCARLLTHCRTGRRR
jgi:hypothetical protein